MEQKNRTVNHLTLFLPAVASTEDAVNGGMHQLVTEHLVQPGGLFSTSHFGTDMHPTASEFFMSLQIGWIAIT